MNESDFSSNTKNHVDVISWPFYRYSILIPKQTRVDLFVWLFISLFLYQNQNSRNDRKAYDLVIEKDVSRMIMDRFPTIINKQIMDLIIEKVKHDFVTSFTDKNGLKSFIFKEETYSFVKTYEELFSSSLEIRYMYQDAITGDIIPFFPDNIIQYDEGSEVFHAYITKNPETSKVKSAYKQYLKIQKLNKNIKSTNENIDVFLADYDDEEETFFDDDYENMFEAEVKEKLNSADISIQFLDGQKALFNYEVKVYVEDNELHVKSPFETFTDTWLNNKFMQAQNVNESFKKYVDDMVKKYTLKNIDEQKYSKLALVKKDIDLQHTSGLYKLTQSIGADHLKKIIMKIDHYFSSNDYEPYWSNVGKYLEALVFELPKFSNKDKKFDYYAEFLNSYGKQNNVDIQKLINQEIHQAWCKGTRNIKAYLSEMIINNNLLSKKSMYYNFINDIFELYNERNRTQHYNTEKITKPETTQIDKLYKISMIFYNL